MPEQEEAATAEEREEEYKTKPWWVVIARTGEFIAGARTEKSAKASAFVLNRVAHGARTEERYRVIERPPDGGL